MEELPPIYFEQITVEPGYVDFEIESGFKEFFHPADNSHKLFEELRRQQKLVEAAIRNSDPRSEVGSQGLTALAESVSTLRRYIGLQKVEAAAELVMREMNQKQYDKIVIFAIHRDVIEAMRLRLAAFHPVTLYGGTPPEKRQRNIDRFQKTNKYKIFIGNITSAGTAITLTAAHHVLFVEQSWVPGDNLQAAMRCHRIGQTKPVSVRNLSLADSIDEKVVSAVQRKTSELALVFDREAKQILGPKK